MAIIFISHICIKKAYGDARMLNLPYRYRTPYPSYSRENLGKKCKKIFQELQAKQLSTRPDMQCGGNLRMRRNAVCGGFLRLLRLKAGYSRITCSRLRLNKRKRFGRLSNFFFLADVTVISHFLLT